jgi:hypothetical protein
MEVTPTPFTYILVFNDSKMRTDSNVDCVLLPIDGLTCNTLLIIPAVLTTLNYALIRCRDVLSARQM